MGISSITLGNHENRHVSSVKEIIKVKPISTVIPTCMEFLDNLAKSIHTYKVMIPTNWKQKDKSTFEMFAYSNRKVSDIDHKAHLILFDPPGESSWDSLKELYSKGKPDEPPTIWIDIRGVGCSSHPKVQKNKIHRDLRFFNSESIVKDLEHLRKTILGSKGKWTISADKYGEYIAAKYLKLFPKSIEKVLWTNQKHKLPWISQLKDQLKEQNQLIIQYFKEYPKDKEKLSQIKKQIPDQLCFDNGNWQICGPDLINTALVYISYKSSRDALHHFIKDLLPDEKLDLKKFKIWVSNMLFLTYGHQNSIHDALFLQDIRGPIQKNDFSGCLLLKEKVFQEDTPLNECNILKHLSRSEKKIMNLKLKYLDL